MQFDGQVWFSFRNPEVWIFYRFLRGLASAGNSVSLEWVPLSDLAEAKAMSTFLAITDPFERGRFLHAMLGLIHIERTPFDDAIVALALSVSGVDIGQSDTGEGELARLADEALSLGVTATPTLYRRGPAAHIRLTEAAVMGDAVETATAILAVTDNDGVWEIRKP